MRNLTCVVVDDEPLAVQLIERFVDRIDFVDLKGSYTDSLEAISAVKKDPVDFVFLDIQMPDMDGMEMARMLPKETRVIFTTAFKEYAYESYDVAAIDFLLKPIRFDKILRACEKMKEFYELRENSITVETKPDKNEIFLKSNGGLLKVAMDEILYVEGMKDYVKIYFKNERPLVTHLKMKDAEELLSGGPFLRVSRSYIINTTHIKRIERSFCVYIGDTMIKVTDQYREDFEKFIKGRTI